MAVVSIIYLFANFHRLSLNVLSASISVEMGLEAWHMGAMGSAFFYSYAIMQIPCGLFADRYSPRRLIFIACAVTALATILFAFSHSFVLMCIARLITGAATALIYIPSLGAIRAAANKTRLGLMTGALVCAGQVGSACSSAPLMVMDRMIGWRPTLIAIGVLMLAVAIPAWLVLPDTAAGKKEAAVKAAEENGEKSGGYIQMLVVLSIWFFITCGTRTSFQGSFGYSFFVEGKAVSDAAAGVYMLLISIGGIVGAFTYGRLCDKYGAFSMLVVSTLFIAGGWGILAFCGGGSHFMLCVAVIVIGIFGSGSVTAIFCCTNRISTPSTRGCTDGIVNCAAFMGTAIITQFNSRIIDLLPLRLASEKYSALMLIFLLLCFASAVAAFGLFRKKHFI